MSIGAVLYLAFIIAMLYYSFIEPTTPPHHGQEHDPVRGARGSPGIIWYFVWKARSKKQGIDVSITFGELPPE